MFRALPTEVFDSSLSNASNNRLSRYHFRAYRHILFIYVLQISNFYRFDREQWGPSSILYQIPHLRGGSVEEETPSPRLVHSSSLAHPCASVVSTAFKTCEAVQHTVLQFR